MNLLLNRIKLGIIRRPYVFLWSIFLSFSVYWTLIESTTSILDYKFVGIGKFIIIFFISVFSAIIYNLPPLHISFILSTTNTKVNVKYGDLFKQNGHKVIAVNEFVDSQIGDLVSPNSLHGKLIESVLGRRSDIFDELIKPELADLQYENVPRKFGKTQKFKIGECLKIQFNNEYYYLPITTHTNIINNKAYTDIPELWLALYGLWEKIRVTANGAAVNLPLIGNGLSGIGIPSSKLLEIIIISLLKYAKVNPINGDINIILLEEQLNEIDLAIIKYQWS